MMQRIEITREDFARHAGVFPPPEVSSVRIFAPGITLEYVFVDAAVGDEVDWLENLYQL